MNITSRDYIGNIKLIFIVFIYLSAMSVKVANAQPKQKKPNILLIVADDLGWQDTGAYGNDEVNTPNIDQLAQEGMTFYGMHTSTAMCSPTRQQLYSGMFPVRNGAYPNHSWSYEGVKSLPQYLRPLGYRVGITGKHDFGPPASYPFKNVGGDGDINKTSIAAIKKFINKNNEQSFALIVASHQPHKPWTMGNPKAYKASSLSVPPYLVDTQKTRKEMTEYYAEITYLDQQVGDILNVLDKTGKKNNTLVMFTSEQGSQFPFAKWTCYEQGLKTAFIVRWPGKIKPQTKNKALMQYVDVVPTLIEAAGGNPDTVLTGRKDALGHAGLDGKSFLSVMRSNKKHFRNYVYGIQTTMGILNDQNFYPIRSINDGKYKYIKNLNAEDEFSNITKPLNTNLYPKKDYWWIDTKLMKSWFKAGGANLNIASRAKLYYKRPPVELYNLKKDPYELNNLAGDSHYNDKVKELDKKLNGWMRQQGDKGLKTELNAMSRNARLIKEQEKGGSK